MSLYYALYPYRSAAPTERLSVIRAEIISPVSHIRGIADLLAIRAASAATLPPSVHTFQHTFHPLAKRLHELLEQATLPYTSDPQIAQERMLFLRTHMQEAIEQLNRMVSQMQDIGDDLTPVFPDTDYWVESLRQASNHIWATIDGMTNDQLELPAHIMEWLAIRDHVHTEAMRANGDVLDALLNAVENAEPQIRAEAAILLRHLNDPRSIRPLENLLHDPDQRVRESAAWTLQQLQPGRAQP
jgi:hypothetical protein